MEEIWRFAAPLTLTHHLLQTFRGLRSKKEIQKAALNYFSVGGGWKLDKAIPKLGIIGIIKLLMFKKGFNIIISTK